MNLDRLNDKTIEHPNEKQEEIRKDAELWIRDYNIPEEIARKYVEIQYDYVHARDKDKKKLLELCDMYFDIYMSPFTIFKDNDVLDFTIDLEKNGIPEKVAKSYIEEIKKQQGVLNKKIIEELAHKYILKYYKKLKI